MKTYLKIMLIAICTVGSWQVFADNYSFMSDTPIAHFTTTDSEIFSRTQTSVLNNTPDGTKVSWQNPKTKAHGYFIPSDTTKNNNTVCRKLTIATHAAGREGLATFNYCKINNVWNAS